MPLRCRLPPLKMVTSCLTLPPSNSHYHSNLLIHAICTALSILPPSISGQPILGITLFPLCNPFKRNMYGHVWIFLFLKKNFKNFCVCVRVRLDTVVTKCIQVKIFPLFFFWNYEFVILFYTMCCVENFILE